MTVRSIIVDCRLVPRVNRGIDDLQSLSVVRSPSSVAATDNGPLTAHRLFRISNRLMRRVLDCWRVSIFEFRVSNRISIHLMD